MDHSLYNFGLNYSAEELKLLKRTSVLTSQVYDRYVQTMQFCVAKSAAARSLLSIGGIYIRKLARETCLLATGRMIHQEM